MDKTTEQIEQELATARQQILKLELQREQERKRILDSTPIKREYYIAEEHKPHNKIYDPAVIVYRLVCVITNITEAKAAGHIVDPDGAGMSYLYNTVTHKIIMPLGGGHIWIGDFHNISEETLAELNQFLIDNPKGGDITQIVVADKKREGKP